MGRDHGPVRQLIEWYIQVYEMFLVLLYCLYCLNVCIVTGQPVYI